VVSLIKVRVTDDFSITDGEAGEGADVAARVPITIMARRPNPSSRTVP